MLDYWYKDRRTLVDFRRGPLGPHFDGFAAHLKANGYSTSNAKYILGRSCLFNAFLIDRGVPECSSIDEATVHAFIDAHLSGVRTTSETYRPRYVARCLLRHLLTYLREQRIIPPAPAPVRAPKSYDWALDPYLVYLRKEYEFQESTLGRVRTMLEAFLDGLGERCTPQYLHRLRPEQIEAHVAGHLKDSPENFRTLASTLRRFLRYCAAQGLVAADLSGLIPTWPRYQLATLPKGVEDRDLERLLHGIPRDSPIGKRDYALVLLMMAYGLRGVSAARLLIDDLDWRKSTVRIGAAKGGKEVVLPLLEPVGRALLDYLRVRPPDRPFRELFLSVRAPFRPLSSLLISHVVRGHMARASVLRRGGGTRTLRHSWAIRALGHQSTMKAIADVLGHRCLDTTFIYTKADLNSLREVAMPWPAGKE